MQLYYVALVRFENGNLYPMLAADLSLLLATVRTGSCTKPKIRGSGVCVAYAETYSDAIVAADRYEVMNVNDKYWREDLIGGHLKLKPWPDSFEGIWTPHNFRKD